MRSLLLASVLLVGCGGVIPGTDGGVDSGTPDAGPVDSGRADSGRPDSGSPDAGPLLYDLNDVSFLYPLQDFGLEKLLKGSSEGLGGPLLPEALFKELPPILIDAPPVYPALRVVSARVDPCFPGLTPGACIHQVRLVLQPVFADAQTGKLDTEDATVHLFYELNDTQWAQVKTALKQLKTLAGSTTDGQPLTVHPTMKAQGLSGPYALALNQLILSVSGKATLSRIATMSLLGFGSRWTFTAFDLVNGQLKQDIIPRLIGNQTVQGFQEIGSETSRNGELVPAPPNDDLSTLLSTTELKLTDDFTLKSALESALMIEHPMKSSPRTIDCASCHVATRARSNAEQLRVMDTLGWAGRFADSRFNLARTDEAANDPKALRSFGYQKRLSALSQRTINESAVIAAALSAAP